VGRGTTEAQSQRLTWVGAFLCRGRNLRFFNKIKERRPVGRYERLAANYLAFINPASIRIGCLLKSQGVGRFQDLNDLPGDSALLVRRQITTGKRRGEAFNKHVLMQERMPEEEAQHFPRCVRSLRVRVGARGTAS
jgi:hypothetical protein